MTTEFTQNSAGSISVPRITIQAFCDTQEIAQALHVASQDRRLARAAFSIHKGGLAGAIQTYEHALTPNLLIIENNLPREELMVELGALANICDPTTNVIIVGHANDVILYRELIKCGISDYVVAPFTSMDIVNSISELYQPVNSEPIGKTVAFIGARGGVGSSAMCHNIAWSIAHKYEREILIADLDVAFGTVGLNFNEDLTEGIANAIEKGDKVDDVFVDRLIRRCGNGINLLTTQADLEKSFDFREDSTDKLVEVLRSAMPFSFLDIPNGWSKWTKHTLTMADEIVITATPDLVSLRNTKNIIEKLRSKRSNDKDPLLILNQVGMPKRAELSVADYENTTGITPSVIVPFDISVFSESQNSGQMIEQTPGGNKVKDVFDVMAQTILGYQPSEMDQTKSQSQSLFAPILNRLRG